MTGRPRQTHCKRGHSLEGLPEKVRRKGCYACQLLRARKKYRNDQAHRERKKKRSAQQRARRARAREENNSGNPL